jgi:hypothetical protein
VFVRSGNNWTQEGHLSAGGGKDFDQFGTSVALDGVTALVGAPFFDNAGGASVGSAYVFVRSGATWNEQAQLLAGDFSNGDHFGDSVALEGDTALVGASRADAVSGSTVGAAYVFVRSGTAWTQQAKLTATEGRGGDRFGGSVALSAETALIGAPGDQTAAGIGAGSAWVFVRSGASWSPRAQLLVANGKAADEFGNAVALSGDTALVGAHLDDRGAPGGGAAFVFVRGGGGWGQQAQLAATGGAPFDGFGVSVAISGDTAIIGAPFDDVAGGHAAGTAFVFVRGGTTWTQQAQLLPNFATSLDQFGFSVALSGNTALIGAPGRMTSGTLPFAVPNSARGSAFVFIRSGTTWTEQAELRASREAFGDQFGNSVSLSDETALIGASFDDTPAGTDAGSAYIFTRSGGVWAQQAQLIASDGAAGDRFGYSVALAGGTALIGARQANPAGKTDAGAAYVFVGGGASWSQQAQLLASDGASSDEFGSSVALSADTALVGAPLDDTGVGTNSGTVYTFSRTGTTWSEQAHFWATDLAANDQFGRSVALSGDVAVVGAPLDDTVAGLDAGSAHVFLRTSTGWSAEAELRAGDSAALDNFGSSVALGGNTVLIGAPNADTTRGSDIGAVYVFRVGVLTDLVATPTSATAILLEWNSVGSANHYEVQRNSGSGFSTIASPALATYTDTVTANTAHVYRVRAIGPAGETSSYSNLDLAATSVFTDDPLVAGVVVKTVHLLEIRTAVESVRAVAGLPAATFSDADPAGVAIKAIHITELRSALDAARSALGLAPLMYTNAPLQGMPIRAIDFTELRNGVR